MNIYTNILTKIFKPVDLTWASKLSCEGVAHLTLAYNDESSSTWAQPTNDLLLIIWIQQSVFVLPERVMWRRGFTLNSNSTTGLWESSTYCNSEINTPLAAYLYHSLPDKRSFDLVMKNWTIFSLYNGKVWYYRKPTLSRRRGGAIVWFWINSFCLLSTHAEFTVIIFCGEWWIRIHLLFVSYPEVLITTTLNVAVQKFLYSSDIQ